MHMALTPTSDTVSASVVRCIPLAKDAIILPHPVTETHEQRVGLDRYRAGARYLILSAATIPISIPGCC